VGAAVIQVELGHLAVDTKIKNARLKFSFNPFDPNLTT
jgi:hypothetical protein